MMRTLVVVILLIVVALFIFSYTGSRTSKNATVAMKEASKEAADKTAEKLEQLRQKLKEERVAEKVKKGADEAVVAVKKGAKKVEELTLDASITAAVKMKLANDELIQARNIDVDTKDGVVTLKGKVSNNAEAERAIQLAKEVTGVKSVKSLLSST
jgi:hyperosmotically inducible periplasmic protein